MRSYQYSVTGLDPAESDDGIQVSTMLHTIIQSGTYTSNHQIYIRFYGYHNNHRNFDFIVTFPNGCNLYGGNVEISLKTTDTNPSVTIDGSIIYSDSTSRNFSIDNGSNIATGKWNFADKTIHQIKGGGYIGYDLKQSWVTFEVAINGPSNSGTEVKGYQFIRV